MNDRKRVRGFTLLEMIVVVGLFAVVAVMAYGGLMSVMTTRANLEVRFDRTAAFQKAYWFLRDDFQNGINRPVRDNNDALDYALRYTALDREVDFTRGGWGNPLRLPRSTLRRIGYWWNSDKKTLVRRTWPVLDRAPQTQSVDTVLLTGVDDVHWRFLDANGQWQDAWPTPQAVAQGTVDAATSGAALNPATALQGGPPPPVAVELTLETSDWGRLRFLFSYGFPQYGSPNQKTGAPPPSQNVFSRPPGGAGAQNALPTAGDVAP